MSDLDSLLAHCLACPADAAQRLILCDALHEAGELEIESALRGPHGEQLIRRVWAVADTLKRVACLRLLWAVAVCESNAPMLTAPNPPSVNEIRRLMGTADARRLVTLSGERAPKFDMSKWKLADDTR